MPSSGLGVCKVAPYLISQPFTVYTDHKPLKALRKHKKPDRLGRWSLLLQQYSFSIVHRAGKDHANADAMTRIVYDGFLHRDDPLEDTIDFFAVFPSQKLPTLEKLREAQENDPLMGRVIQFLRGKCRKSPEVQEALGGAERIPFLLEDF